MKSELKQPYVNAGYFSITGAVTMLIGAALWGSSGTDLWQALENNEMENYLSQSGNAKHVLAANTFFWALGVLLLGTGGTLIAGLSGRHKLTSQMATMAIRTGVPVALVSFIAMLSLVICQPPVEMAKPIGWVGARLDDIATLLLIGAGPLFLSIAGRKDWVPRWLMIWGGLAGAAGCLCIIALLTNTAALGFVIIPFGMGWMIAAGIVLVKKAKT